MNYVVIDRATGRVKRHGSCRAVDLPAQADKAGEELRAAAPEIISSLVEARRSEISQLRAANAKRAATHKAGRRPRSP